MNFILFIGGIGFLLFGMNTAQEALDSIMNSKIKETLSKVCCSTIKSTLTGALTTSVLQSSSGVTAILIGLVNNGIIEAKDTCSLIAGINIGTSATAWIIALCGDNAVKAELLYPALLLIGCIFIILSKNYKLNNTGRLLSGFALIIAGMDNMSAALLPVISKDVFSGFTNPLTGFLSGVTVTAVIQSSSASIGILQIISTGGNINADIAIPIIMGQNIGTCATALIACIGVHGEGGKVALYHLMFNVYGVMVFGALFFFIRNIIDFGFTVNPIGIAAIHSIFNILSAMLFIFFTKKKRLTKSQPPVH